MWSLVIEMLIFIDEISLIFWLLVKLDTTLRIDNQLERISLFYWSYRQNIDKYQFLLIFWEFSRYFYWSTCWLRSKCSSAPLKIIFSLQRGRWGLMKLGSSKKKRRYEVVCSIGWWVQKKRLSRTPSPTCGSEFSYKSPHPSNRTVARHRKSGDQTTPDPRFLIIFKIPPTKT